VTIAGGIKTHEEVGADLYVGAGPTYATPSSVRITPVGANMLVGGTQLATDDINTNEVNGYAGTN